MRASLYHAIDDELRDRVDGVAAFMKLQVASLSLPELRVEFREHSVLGPGGDLFQVCDEHGQWLYRSAALESARVPIPPPGSRAIPHFQNQEIDRDALRFYWQAIVVNGKAYTVQVAALMNEGLEALERFRWMLMLAAPLLLVIASAGGYWLSTRALRPFDEISRAAQGIGIENLADRVRVPRTGDQLQRLSETLNATFARLEASVNRMKQFTADASHELRAPVSLIRTTAEVAVQRDRSAGEYREALQEILEESERTSQVVERLMLLARADSGKETLDLLPVDAREVVQEAAGQGEKLARARRLSFTVNLPKDPISIRADTDALRRALLILIDNAVKYTSEGGSVTIGLELRYGSAVTWVSDTGTGIAAEDIPHIFDRFWRADKARTRGEGGAGLGLSIAKWIVDTHGGSIEVESKLGKGSTFRLRLPFLD